MMRNDCCRAARFAILALSLTGFLCAAFAGARAQTRLGAEFVINSYTKGDQYLAAVASDGAGNFVVVWNSAQDGSSLGVFGQRFDSAGNAVGSEFQVNSYTQGNQFVARVAQDPTGGFVVSWRSDGQDASSGGIFAQRYDSLGMAVGSEFLVNTYTPGAQAYPAVGADPDGDFTVVWHSPGDGSSDGAFGQRYDSGGAPLGPQFQVNTYTPSAQRFARIAVLDSGDFLVAWNQTDCSGSCERVLGQRFASTGTKVGAVMVLSPPIGFGGFEGLGANPSTGNIVFAYGDGGMVLAQRYASSGVAVGSQFQVDDIPFSNADPQVATNATGEFVVTWTNYDTTCDDPAFDAGGCGVFGRTFDGGGQSLGDTFQVNSHTLLSQEGSAVAWTAPDEFVAVWTTKGQDDCGPQSGTGIFAQRFDSAGAPLGTEHQVNEFTPSFQDMGDIAADPSGGFVVTWSSDGQDGDSNAVFARRYDSAGAALGTEFQVNTYTGRSQGNPFVASDPAGYFVVAWTSAGSAAYGQDGSESGVFAQRLDGSGLPLGTEFQVSTYTPFHQQQTRVATDAAGNFVVVWSDTGIGGPFLHGRDGSRTGMFGQRYDNSGAALGTNFQINTYTLFEQSDPRIAMRPGGDFVATWLEGDSSDTGIWGARFTSSGVRIGAQFQVNLYTTFGQLNPAIGLDAAGNSIVAWDSGDNPFGGWQDGEFAGIFARRYDSSGAPLSGEFQVNSYTIGYQRLPAVAVDPSSGAFVIVWQSEEQDGEVHGLYAQRYASTGAPVGTEFQINTYTASDQRHPRITYDAAGNFVVAWDSRYQDGCGPGGDSRGIAGQRFRILPTPTATASPTPTSTPIRAVCGASPSGGCATPGKAIIKMQDKGGNKKLLWKWTKGTVVPGAFGNPVASTSYRLCVYDNGALIMNPLADAGSPWQPTSKGFKFLLPGGNADGIYKVILKTGTGNAKILVKGKGPNLELPFPTGIAPSNTVTVQFVKDVPSGSECWQSVFTPPNGGSDSEKFKDKLP